MENLILFFIVMIFVILLSNQYLYLLIYGVKKFALMYVGDVAPPRASTCKRFFVGYFDVAVCYLFSVIFQTILTLNVIIVSTSGI